MASVDTLLESFQRGWTPPLDLLPSEWSETYRKLSSISSEPGTWRNSRVPYMPEIMDCMSQEDPCEFVVFQKPVQVAASEGMNNCIGHGIHILKKSMMLILPTIEVMETYSDLRIQTMIRDTPALAELVSDHSRDETNKKLLKTFPGGFLKMAGANSPASLRSLPLGYLYCDEVDGWPLTCGEEGAPLDLALKRTDTFPNRKVWLSSTPVEKETSVICDWYDRSSKGLYYVPCPFCLTFQPLLFGHLIYKNRQDPAYECDSCNKLIPETYKHEMLLNGKWVHENNDERKIRGFFLNGLYSPVGWVNTWGNMAYEWKDAQKALKNRNKKKLVTFKNLRLGEPVEHAELEDDEPDVEEYQARCEDYPEVLPNAVKLVTAAVDVHDDRLEYEIIAWGPGKENWSWEWGEIPGSPGVEPTKGVWQQLYLHLTEWSKRREDGSLLKIAVKCVDSGGHFTDETYKFCNKYFRVGFVATKGYNVSGKPLATRTKTEKGQRLYLIGTETAKDTVYEHMKVSEPGPGYCHFPKRKEYDEEYFKQIFAEEPKTRTRNGRRVRIYVNRRRRNEKLDLRVMNLVALELTDPKQVLLSVESPPEQPPPPQDPPRSGERGRWIQGNRGWLNR